jgi:hypothetical protein
MLRFCLPSRSALSALVSLLLLAVACDAPVHGGPEGDARDNARAEPKSESDAKPEGDSRAQDDDIPDQATTPKEPNDDWLKSSTVSLRNRVRVPAASERLKASEIVAQLKRYDPGSLLRCEVQDDPAYRAVVDALGGVSWGYNVQLLEDMSQPELRRGPPILHPSLPTGLNAGGSAPVEIAEADIVGLSEGAALFYSASHGLLLVDLTAAEPRFSCAVKLPGRVQDFYYYRDHLVALLGTALIHFKVESGSVRFVESIALNGDVLDTRRFNDRLVIYTNMPIGAASARGGLSNGTVVNGQRHRSLQVFKLGDKLSEELNESLINTTVDDAYLSSGVIASDTEIGSTVHTASSYGDELWASDHYFVVSERLDVTKLNGWITQNYQVCTKSHTDSASYHFCSTRYETRPNPSYVPPDNSGGDRACHGVTLSECLRSVSRASNPTIQVPVGVECEDREYARWVCDAYENRSYTYPELRVETATRLTIFEYTATGFVRLDGKVAEISTPALAELQANASVPKLTTTSATFDLSIPGYLQTLQFQNGFLYAIAAGVLQVYSMGDSSLVRTSSLQVANDTLQSSLFSDDKLYLSDFGYTFSSFMDRSVLRVIDLSNPGFPKQVSQDQSLPGGHTSILATSSGILTIGAVQNFEGDIRNVLKLGLFADPYTSEKAYLIVGSDLAAAYYGDKKSSYFDGSTNRLFLPYRGPERGDAGEWRARVGISHLLADAIASEGALAMAETVDRVRPRPGHVDQYLSFSQNSIGWLTQSEGKWGVKALLAYYTPFALYRRNDGDDYVELSRLGTRCQLRWVNASTLNVRVLASEASSFECGSGAPMAYADNVLFGIAEGVHFAGDGKVSMLSADQIMDVQAKVKQRRTCLLSQTTSDELIDYDMLPPPEEFTCYTPEQYRNILAKRTMASYLVDGAASSSSTF